MAAALVATSGGLVGCGDADDPVVTPTAVATPVASATPLATATPSVVSTPLPTDDAAATAESICEDALSLAGDLSKEGSIAVQEDAAANLLHDTADRLAAGGVDTLGGALEAYASARDELAIAYDRDLVSGVDAANTEVTAAGGEVEAAAGELGADACVELTGI